MKPKTQTKKFKQTEIGMIPEDWEVRRIGEIAEFTRGFSYKGSEKNTSEGKYVFITLNSVKEGGGFKKEFSFISSDRIKERHFINRGEIFIANTEQTKTGTLLGSPAIVEFPKGYTKSRGVFSHHITKVTIKTDIDKLFLYYFLIFNQKNAVQYHTGSVIWALDVENWSKNEIIPLPPLPEQRAIAKVLSAFDDKIELNQQMNKTLEAIGQAIFKHWFVDFEFPNEEGKPYKSSGGEMVYNEELGKEIPKGWRVGRLGGIVDVIKGCSYKSEDLKESKIALVTLKSINRGGGFNQEGYKEYIGKYTKEQEIEDGEIIVAQTDITQDGEVVGRPAIVNSLGRYSKLVASLDLQIIRPKNFSKWFIYYLLKTEDFHNHALSYTSGTTVLHLNKNAVSDFITLLPSKEILEQFDKIIQVSQNKIVINEFESLTLSHLRDSLLPKLMSGKIRVPVAVRT